MGSRTAVLHHPPFPIHNSNGRSRTQSPFSIAALGVTTVLAHRNGRLISFTSPATGSIRGKQDASSSAERQAHCWAQSAWVGHSTRSVERKSTSGRCRWPSSSYTRYRGWCWARFPSPGRSSAASSPGRQKDWNNFGIYKTIQFPDKKCPNGEIQQKHYQNNLSNCGK